MAITRTQIARQLLQFGGGADMGAERGPETGREVGPVSGGPGITGEGRNPITQFSRDVDTTDLTFMNQARRSVNPLGVLTEMPGSIGIIARALSPDPFRQRPKIRDFVNRQDESDNSQIVLPIMPDQAPSITEDEEKDSKGLEGLRLAFRADGGPIGGEFDFESARQMYGLGKLVKKVSRTVKKIAKSPVGKAAIVGAGFGLAGMGPFKGLASTPFGTGLTKNFLKFKGTPLGETIFGRAIGDTDMTRSGGLFSLIRDNPVSSAITAASLLPLLGIGTGEESEKEAEELIRGAGLDINAIRANPNQFLARRFRAEGGSMKEPVAKKTMPLLDLDGKEMDLRAEGGFVPLGRMEKADDVPARLSKNEFVFTADAVRNAGDGDVDKGAEVMYNMMKNLESGGDVSEESQGLEGARKMFQTSQRLEEVL